MKSLPKPSLKSSVAFDPTSLPLTPIDDASTFRGAEASFALNERAILRLEEEMNAKIEAIRTKYAAQLDPLYERRTRLTNGIREYVKGLWNKTSLRQAFRYVVAVWSIPKGSLVIEDEEKTVASLKAMGLTHLIRTVEEVKKNEFKDIFLNDEKMLEALGAKFEKPKPFIKAIEVNWETVGSSDEIEKKAAKALVGVRSMVKVGAVIDKIYHKKGQRQA